VCKLLAALAALVILATACSSESDAPVAVPDPEPSEEAPVPAATPTPPPPATAAADINVSDETPTMEELQGAGLTTEEAECFIDTIDPDGDGTIDIEFFGEALACQ